MSIANLTPSQLRQAANLIEKIASLEKQLTQIQGIKAATPTATPVKKKRGISAAGKARISAAAKLRWAKIKATKAKSAPKAASKIVKPVKKKFTLSAAARAKISAAAKARWAKVKADAVKK